MSYEKYRKSIHREKNGNMQDDNACCPEPNIVPVDGNLVCMNCATVHGPDLIGCEQRAFTTEEVNNRKRTEKVWRDVGPRTLIGRERKDSHGNVIKGKEKTLYNRLDKIQISLIDSLERNKWEAKPKLDLLASKLNIPGYVKETAWRIYVEAAKKKLTMGRSISGFVTAAIYAAIRIHELPRILDEVCDCQLIPRRTVHQALGLLLKEVLPEMDLKYKPITSKHLIYKFGSDLELPMEIQNEAVKMLKVAKKNGLPTIGKDPRGIAASALYIAARNSKNRLYHRTQSLVADTAKITEVTLRSRAKDIRKLIQ
jgi:transcription initiation factor TFIIIB Brf1 subunit/transcription initiation factor TFIIB